MCSLHDSVSPLSTDMVSWLSIYHHGPASQAIQITDDADGRHNLAAFPTEQCEVLSATQPNGGEALMRQTLLTAAAAVLFAGAFVWHAEAAPWSGAAKIGAAAKDASVVESVGC